MQYTEFGTQATCMGRRSICPIFTLRPGLPKAATLIALCQSVVLDVYSLDPLREILRPFALWRKRSYGGISLNLGDIYAPRLMDKKTWIWRV